MPARVNFTRPPPSGGAWGPRSPQAPPGPRLPLPPHRREDVPDGGEAGEGPPRAPWHRGAVHLRAETQDPDREQGRGPRDDERERPAVLEPHRAEQEQRAVADHAWGPHRGEGGERAGQDWGGPLRGEERRGGR